MNKITSKQLNVLTTTTSEQHSSSNQSPLTTLFLNRHFKKTISSTYQLPAMTHYSSGRRFLNFIARIASLFGIETATGRLTKKDRSTYLEARTKYERKIVSDIIIQYEEEINLTNQDSVIKSLTTMLSSNDRTDFIIAKTLLKYIDPEKFEKAIKKRAEKIITNTNPKRNSDYQFFLKNFDIAYDIFPAYERLVSEQADARIYTVGEHDHQNYYTYQNTTDQEAFYKEKISNFYIAMRDYASIHEILPAILTQPVDAEAIKGVFAFPWSFTEEKHIEAIKQYPEAVPELIKIFIETPKNAEEALLLAQTLPKKEAQELLIPLVRQDKKIEYPKDFWENMGKKKNIHLPDKSNIYKLIDIFTPCQLSSESLKTLLEIPRHGEIATHLSVILARQEDSFFHQQIEGKPISFFVLEYINKCSHDIYFWKNDKDLKMGMGQLIKKILKETPNIENDHIANYIKSPWTFAAWLENSKEPLSTVLPSGKRIIDVLLPCLEFPYSVHNFLAKINDETKNEGTPLSWSQLIPKIPIAALPELVRHRTTYLSDDDNRMAMTRLIKSDLDFKDSFAADTLSDVIAFGDLDLSDLVKRGTLNKSQILKVIEGVFKLSTDLKKQVDTLATTIDIFDTYEMNSHTQLITQHLGRLYPELQGKPDLCRSLHSHLLGNPKLAWMAKSFET